ncbi:unnamed protein product, partial [Prunus brigantina]
SRPDSSHSLLSLFSLLFFPPLSRCTCFLLSHDHSPLRSIRLCLLRLPLLPLLSLSLSSLLLLQSTKVCNIILGLLIWVLISSLPRQIPSSPQTLISYNFTSSFISYNFTSLTPKYLEGFQL